MNLSGRVVAGEFQFGGCGIVNVGAIGAYAASQAGIAKLI